MTGRRRAGLLAIVAIAIATVGFAHADVPEAIDLAMPLHQGDYLALRFNLTPGSDLTIFGEHTICHNSTAPFQTVIGQAAFRIADRSRVAAGSLWPSGLVWGAPGSEVVAVGIEGDRVIGPNLITESNCGGSYISYTARSSRANESLTILLLNMAPSGSVNIHANWTRNVTSYDAFVGQGIAHTKDEFEHGLHASYYPLPAGVGAGALLKDNVQASHGVVGYFMPAYPGSTGETHWSCELSGVACGTPDAFGAIQLAGNAPSQLNVTIDVDTRVGENPYYALGVIPLPDDSYLD